ncbi:MAG: inositol-3-phosphate synthase, partial [Deltaproteobacteria bacterium]|nr:inositol-3-phosphate synthase [Deltaproteobacteria bacterium]
MTDTKKTEISSSSGNLGILTPGLGAVSTTFIAGVEAIRRGIAKPIGSLTQMGTIRLGKRTDDRVPKIAEFIDLPKLDDLRFGGWDVFHDNCFQAALNCQVLKREQLNEIQPFLERIKPMSAVFNPRYVKKLRGDISNVKDGKNLMEKAEALMKDMDQFADREKVARLVVVWCGSTEAYLEEKPVHKDLASFEKGL